MPGNVSNQNFAFDRSSTFRNPAVDDAFFTNPPHRHSSSNFRGSRRVSHRWSQRRHNNKDQHQRSKTPVSYEVSKNHEIRATSYSHGSNTMRNDLKITFNQGFKFSDQSGQTADFYAAKQMEDVVSKFDLLKLGNNQNRNRETSAATNKNTNVCPINVRSIDLFPTKEDIQRSGLPSLEANKTKGAYDNVEHYVRVQFLLLREDFVASLRKGVQHFRSESLNLQNPSQLKYDGIRIYPGTQFERVQSAKNNKLGILVDFDPDCKLKNVKWKESKRFMYGSLLLFTVDNFTTFFHCTVVDRDIEALRAGKILVSLPENVTKDSRFFKRPYLMAECEAYFDPYYLVMKLLREFDESTFPMAKYIVSGDMHTQYPSYVSDFGVLRVHNRVIAPITTDKAEWPTAEEMQLDRFQFEAFKAALTQDLCIIQGPPGTGKTFIGLKIVQCIRHNAITFNHKLKLPILVVCSANHAVDQFLEGVLQFTPNVVRVGGQSRSEVMKKYNLRELARNENKFISDKFLIMKIKSCQRDINRLGQLLKCAEKPTGILSASVLGDILGPKHQYLGRDDDSLVKWLLSEEQLGKVYDEPDFKKFKSQNENKTVMPVKKPEVDQFEEDEDNVDVEGEEEEEEQTAGPHQKPSYEIEDINCYSISLQVLSSNCIACIDQYDQLKKDAAKQRLRSKSSNDQKFFQIKLNTCKNNIIYFMTKYHNLKDHLNNAIHNTTLCQQNQLFYMDPNKLDIKDRWLIYWQWTLQLVGVLSKKLRELQKLHSQTVQQLEECRQQQHLEVLRKADVVGMTTTGAARLNTLLKLLHPAVVVIEEAGEVLETHVIASLTNKCQHVILIGDHMQLRPITATYEMSKFYDMNVSLFERLVNNKMNCPVLNVQHRMRPEISCLISPLIYENLQNHDSVKHFEAVRGVEKNVFFVDHNEFEKTIFDTSSKQNEYEAKFVIHLAMYLIQQQYDPTKITILTTYSAQKILLQNFQRQYSLDSRVKCIVVDKYQGEENDIILLSLVRSNADGNIGFLNTKNRVCVALSRAKKGFFMIGNMSCLAKKCSLWQNIRKTLLDKNAIGTKLPLYCSIHEKRTLVASIEDFSHVKDGGCDAQCEQRLDCGHICLSRCHYTGGDHPEVKCCNSVLTTSMPRGHRVNLECSQEPKTENRNQCRRTFNSTAMKPSIIVRNQYQDYFPYRSFGGTPTLPKHSYSFSPIIQQKRRSFFSNCCLL